MFAVLLNRPGRKVLGAPPAELTCPEDLHVSQVILSEILAQPSYSEFCGFDPAHSSPIPYEGKEQPIEVLRLLV